MKKKIFISDPLEKDIAFLLTNLNIKFVHESEEKSQRLDFYLPDFDIYIEVKQYHTDRVNEQLKSKDNIILIQGKKSINALKLLLKK